MAKQVFYRDLDLSFSKNPITNDVAQKTDIESVKRSVRNLLSFKKNEKPFHPEISSGIYDLFFENYNPISSNKMQDTIKFLIQKYEKRAILGDVILSPSPDLNGINIKIVFSVNNQPTELNLVFNLARNR